MPQTKILVDTNAYLRLAQSIRPLLSQPFGDEQYCLYVIPELNGELENRKLANKFPWVSESEYAENRMSFPLPGKKEKIAIQQTCEFIWGYVQTGFPGPSRVDVRYLAYCVELEMPVVTDDGDMTELAKEYGVKVLTSLQLLKLMLDCGHIEMAAIEGMEKYWRYIKDTPRNLNKDFKRLFKVE